MTHFSSWLFLVFVATRNAEGAVMTFAVGGTLRG
jgi:hypothetical protein